MIWSFWVCLKGIVFKKDNKRRNERIKTVHNDIASVRFVTLCSNWVQRRLKTTTQEKRHRQRPVIQWKRHFVAACTCFCVAGDGLAGWERTVWIWWSALCYNGYSLIDWLAKGSKKRLKWIRLIFSRWDWKEANSKSNSDLNMPDVCFSDVLSWILFKGT